MGLVNLNRDAANLLAPTCASDKGIKARRKREAKRQNKCETRNKTVFRTRLRHPETINSVPLNSVLRIKQTGV